MIVADFRLFINMLRFMLVEQVLHIMQNQDYPRFCIFSTANICIFALRYIRRNGKYGEKAMQTFVKPSSQPSE